MIDQRRPVAIVTGGRRGIGLGIVRALAKAGFNVAFTGVSEPSDESNKIINELAALGAKSEYIKSDVADVATHAGTVDAVAAQLGPIDCLVNNAGIASVVRGDFLELIPENFDAIISTNLRGTVFFTQAVARSMLASKQSTHPKSIISITSVSAVMSSPERLDYCITKAALAAFTQGLTLRLAADGIAVFEVRPGIIRTDMTAKVSGKYDTLIEGGLVPVKRWGEPDDIGAAVAALASGSFAFATGSVIHADGALSINRL